MPISIASTVPLTGTATAGGHLRLFTLRLKMIWAVLLLVTIFAGITPIPLVAPRIFYPFCLMKAMLFLALGFLAPLAFRRLHVINRGLLLALVSSVTVELSQSLIQRGHSFHVLELGLKLVIIFAGFSWGVVSRYEHLLTIGRARLRLTDALSEC